MDQETGMVIVGSAFGSAKLIEKLLGPTADYIGKGIEKWTERRVQNVRNIFSIAVRKLGDRLQADGAVPPKVLRAVFNEGSYCEDALAAEYFGGVLASSRSEIPRDDRGATFLAQINRLSSYQVRCHYVFYRCLKALCDGQADGFREADSVGEVVIGVPQDSFSRAMEFSEQEKAKLRTIIHQTLYGLHREELGGEYWAALGIRLSQIAIPDRGARPLHGVEFEPTPSGIDLFLWAHGRGDLSYADFLDTSVKFEPVAGIAIPSDCRLVLPLGPVPIA